MHNTFVHFVACNGKIQHAFLGTFDAFNSITNAEIMGFMTL